MFDNIFWVPLPEGKPWWPGMVVRLDRLDPERHASGMEFFSRVMERRGRDALNKDVLVVLCSTVGSASETGGHKFAVVPRTSLRPFFAYKDAFGDGVIASGPHEGKACSAKDRKKIKETLVFVADLIKRCNGSEPQPAPQQQPAQPSPVPVLEPSPSVYNLPSGPAKPLYGKGARSEENKELVKLKKELQSLKKKKLQQSARAHSTSPVPESPIDAIDHKVPLMTGQVLAIATQLLPECYPELNSQTVRLWDFCHSFSQELSLVAPSADQNLLRAQPSFASLTTFEACLAEPACPLFSEIASRLVSFLSISSGTDCDNRWDFSGPLLKARLGSKCTELTWECLLDTLIEAGIVDRPRNHLDKRETLEDIVNAICKLRTTKEVFAWRLQEEASERSNPFDAVVPEHHVPMIEIKTPSGAARNRAFVDEISNITDFFVAETTIEPLRDTLESLDMNGMVVGRTPELARAMEWEEKLYGKFLSTVRQFVLARRVRSMSFGKDHFGRSLYSFLGDFAEEECRVWARDDTNDRWFVYRGEMVLRQLMEILPDRDSRQAIIAVIYTSRVRFRPSTLGEMRQAKASGWRFTRNQLINRRVMQYTPENGIRPGFVVAFRQAGLGKVQYKVVFSKQDWASATDMFEDEVIHLITHSDRLIGDFPLASATLELPPHTFNLPWLRVHPEETVLALVQSHVKRAIGFGVVLATTAPIPSHPDCDALVLQDGGEFVQVFGRAQLQDVIKLGVALSTRNTYVVDGILYPRLNRVERFRPLMHLAGPPVGAAGLIKLWGTDVGDSIENLRKPFLDSEQQLEVALKPGFELWPSKEHGELWRESVKAAKDVKDFALVLECLLSLAERTVEEGKLATALAATTTSSSLDALSTASTLVPQQHQDIGVKKDDSIQQQSEPAASVIAEDGQGTTREEEEDAKKKEDESRKRQKMDEEESSVVHHPAEGTIEAADVVELDGGNLEAQMEEADKVMQEQIESSSPRPKQEEDTASTLPPKIQEMQAVELPPSAVFIPDVVLAPPSAQQQQPQSVVKETRSPRRQSTTTTSVSDSPRRSPRILAAESPRRESPRKASSSSSTSSSPRRMEEISSAAATSMTTETPRKQSLSSSGSSPRKTEESVAVPSSQASSEDDSKKASKGEEASPVVQSIESSGTESVVESNAEQLPSIVEEEAQLKLEGAAAAVDEPSAPPPPPPPPALGQEEEKQEDDAKEQA